MSSNQLVKLLEKHNGKRKESSSNPFPHIHKKQRSTIQASKDTSDAQFLGSYSKNSNGNRSSSVQALDQRQDLSFKHLK